MKLRLLPVFILLSLCILSCEEENAPDAVDEVLEVELQVNEMYTFDTQYSGDEQGAGIVTQASHFETSEIIRNETTGFSPVYYYQPAAGFIGTDEVEIQMVNGSLSPDVADEIKRLKIIFTITE